MRWIAVYLVFFLISALSSAFQYNKASAADRVALVVGNGDYLESPKLANPANDAVLVTSSLKSIGFEVVLLTDASQAEMQDGLSRFGRLAENASVALFYYAGHGIQADGRNWLIPVDASIQSRTDLPANSIGANTVLELMELSGAKARIIVLDACRNNPLPRSVSRSANRGLAKIENSAAGNMFVFATAPGDVALDGTGNNSPFSKALAAKIQLPGLEVRQMIGHVRRQVMAETGDKQVPWVNEAIVGDLYLSSAPNQQPGSPAPATANETTPSNGRSDLVAQEIAFWESVKDSGDRKMLMMYANKYPAGIFVDLAMLKMQILQQSETAKPGNKVQDNSNSETGHQKDLRADLQVDRSIRQRQEMEQAVRRLLIDLENIASSDAEQMLTDLPKLYANRVYFYSKPMELSDIRKDKKRFVKRWPQRSYRLREDNSNISCISPAARCSFDGIMDWQVASQRRNAFSSGFSNLHLEIEFFGGEARIVVESGDVLHRN